MNEERFTRKKLDVSFPWNAVNYLLSKYSIDEIAVPTYDFAKTFERVFPLSKQTHYLIRRRKIMPCCVGMHKKLKIAVSNTPGCWLTKAVSKLALSRLSSKAHAPIRMVNHHVAHAYSAIQSGFKKSLVITLDGVGDGLSGSLGIWNGKELEILKTYPFWKSIAQFYEFVTYHLGFRELEDEGKVTALADYAYPTKNVFQDFFIIDGTDIIPRFSLLEMHDAIRRIAWLYPREEVAWMAQRSIEQWVTQLVGNAVQEYGIRNVSFAGGLFANIKLNMVLREELGIRYFVFPHMGDGGLAAGAALALEQSSSKLRNVYLGPSFEIDQDMIRKYGFRVEETETPWEDAAEISDGGYVLWYQGRMEYGPRALGNRSIVARPDSLEAKDRLNMSVKKRQWFQPFCPSVLWEDSKKLFHSVKQREPFMTMGYRVRKEYWEDMKAVTNVDHSARPQMVAQENPAYRKLIKAVKKEIGIGAVLNTSFNIHGKPIVMTPEDALRTMKTTNSPVMVMENYVVRK